MSATTIAWAIVIALSGALAALFYKNGKSDQSKIDTDGALAQAKQTQAMAKEAFNAEQNINSKPLPLDSNSVIDRLP